MGTRHLHIFPTQKKDRKKVQYLQWDGDPKIQLEKFSKELRSFNICMSLMTYKEKKEKVSTWIDFLDSYYKFRSFDSPHSIDAGWRCEIKKRNFFSTLKKDYSIVSYMYEWDENCNLTVYDGRDGIEKLFTISLNDLTNKKVNFQKVLKGLIPSA